MITPLVQRQEAPEEEELQTKPLLQRQEAPQEEELQAKPLVQRQEAPAEEELQAKPLVQRQEAPQEEELQAKPLLQRQEAPAEEELQAKPLLQRQEAAPEEEELQAKRSPQESEASHNDASENLENQLNSSKGGGSPLPDDVRSFMEPRFGADFSQVRVHTDSQAVQMNQAVGAQAFTHGSDIYFGSGKSPGISDLTAHELTHVVQQTAAVQRKEGIEQLWDKSEQQANRVASEAMTKTPMPESQTATPNVQADWLSDAASAVGDALDIRSDEGELDEWEDYQDAVKAQQEFSSQSYSAENFQSTTKLGMFDAIYNPSGGALKIICKCKFNFVSGSPAQFPDATPEELAWTDEAAMNDWKSRFISTVSSTWSSGGHIFYSQKDWWESLAAKVSVEIREVSEDEHFGLTITKIPPGGKHTSGVYRPKTGFFGYTPGRGDFDSEDLETVRKPGGMQTPAVHEAGHMLGLDDEYIDPKDSSTPAHSDLVESEFGHGSARGTDGRIMSGGNDIQPEHGVTFLEALKNATDMSEWSATKKTPRPIPMNPALKNVGDFPQPSSDRVPV
jgi:hypothetical protein